MTYGQMVVTMLAAVIIAGFVIDWWLGPDDDHDEDYTFDVGASEVTVDNFDMIPDDARNVYGADQDRYLRTLNATEGSDAKSK